MRLDPVPPGAQLRAEQGSILAILYLGIEKLLHSRPGCIDEMEIVRHCDDTTLLARHSSLGTYFTEDTQVGR